MELLPRALQSVVDQTFLDWELILVDDGSTDDTVEWFLEQFVSKQPKDIQNKLKLVVLESNRGVSFARNEGVRQSKGDWIFFLDSDDEWLPKKLEKQFQYQSENPQLRISQTREIWMRDGVRVNPRPIYGKAEGDLFNLSLQHCAITPSSVMIRIDLWEESGGFDIRLLSCEDYDLWIRIASKETVGLLDEDLLIRYAGHNDQLSFLYPAMDRFRIYSILKLLSETELTSNQVQSAISSLESKMVPILTGKAKRNESLAVLKEILSAVSFWKTNPNSEFSFPESWKDYLLKHSHWQKG